MVGRSLHRQGILACYCPTSTTGRPAHLSPRAWPAQDHGPCSSEPPANLLTHLFAKLLLAGGSFIFGNIEPIEDVEFFKDRVTIARHRRNAQQFGRRRARAGDLLSAYRVGAIAEREAAQLRHVCRGEGSADRSTEIHAKLFQFGPVIGQNQAGIPRAGPGGSRRREFFITSRPARPPEARPPASSPAGALDKPPLWCGWPFWRL